MRNRGIFFGVLVVFAFLLIVPSFIFAENSETGNLSEWRMFGRYLNHTAWDGVSFPIIPGLNNANFSATLNTASIPAVADGYVYIGGYQLNASNISQLINSYSGTSLSSYVTIANGYAFVGGTSDNILYQLNASNISQQIANYTATSIFASSPAVADGYVYASNYDSLIYQLNASNISQLVHSYGTGNNIQYSSPAVANGYVYVGSNDRRLYQLNASNISQQIANYTTGAFVASSPAVANGYVYIVSQDNQLYQLNASNVSQLISNYGVTGFARSTPAVADGYVYIGGGFVDHKIFQLNASNVSIFVNSYTTGNSIQYSSPTVANGYVYIGSYDTKLYQLNASNVSIFVNSYTTGNSIQSSPAVANGYVYIGSTDGKLYQLNATNISLANQDLVYPQVTITSPTASTYTSANINFNIISSENSTANFTLDGGATNYSMTANATGTGFNYTLTWIAGGSHIARFYVADVAGNINSSVNVSFVVNLPSENSSEWWMVGKNLNRTAWDGGSFFISGSNYENGSFTADSPISIANGYIYFGNGGAIRQINASNISQLIASYSTIGGIVSAPSIFGNNMYFGNAQGIVYQLNASDVSQLINSYSAGSSTEAATPLIANGFIYSPAASKFLQLNYSSISQLVNSLPLGASTAAGSAYNSRFVYFAGRIAATGIVRQLNASNVSQQITNFSTSSWITSSFAVWNNNIYFGCNDNKVYQLNASNVSQLFNSYTTGGQIASSPAIFNGYLYIGSNDGYVYQLNASNVSQQIANYSTGSAVGPLLITESSVYAGSNKLYQLNASNVSQFISAAGYSPRSLAYANQNIFFSTTSSIHRLNASKIDFTAPSLNFSSETETSGATITRNNITINVTASDSESGLKNITIRLYNSSQLLFTNNSNSSSFNITYLALNDGTYYFNSTSFDNAGNKNDSLTRNVIINTYVAPVGDVGGGGSSGGANILPIYKNNQTINKTLEIIEEYTNETNVTLINSSYCYDSDGGKNYYTSGNTSFTFEDDYYSVTDFEVDNSTIREFYCENNTLKGENYKCEKGVSNGSCISSIPNVVFSSAKNDSGGAFESSNLMYCKNYTYHIPNSVEASDSYFGYSALNAIDGDLDTRWHGEFTTSFPKYLLFDMGKTHCFRSLDLYFHEWDLPIRGDIQISQDGKSWNSVIINRTFFSTRNVEVNFPVISLARYVRFVEKSSSRQHGELSEIKFFAGDYARK